MIVTTTHTIEGRKITQYLGIVTGEVIAGANVFRDTFAQIRDFIGGRSRAYEKVLIRAKEQAIGEMVTRAREIGANAVVGVDIDYETVGKKGQMLMVSVSGTAIIVE